MLAVDAADIRFITDSRSSLPTFRRLLDEGTFFPLESTADRMSASVWPSFYTGRMPGDHGISHHIQWHAGSMRMRRLSGDWFRNQPFWYDLDRQGIRTCAVDVPFAFPGSLGHGVEIINWGSHDLVGRFSAAPARFAREVRRRFGRHPMGYEIPVNKSARESRMLHEQLLAGTRLKGELLQWLMQTVEWDFFLGVFGECHRAGHILWPGAGESAGLFPENALLEVYRAVDTCLGSLLESVDRQSTRVMVFSLHGMRANFSQEHFARRIMDRINARFMPDSAATAEVATAAPGKQGGVIRRLRESVPAKWQYALARAVPVGVRDWVVDREVTGGIDWSGTRGIALRSDAHSFVRFNLRGRERDGILDPGSDDYRSYRDWVIRCFLSLEACDTGEPIVQDVLDGDEVLSGERRDLLPDLVIRWAHRQPAMRIRSAELGEISAEPETGRTGEHDTHGFALLRDAAGGPDPLPPLRHTTHFPRFVRHLLGVPEPHPGM